MKHYSMGLEHGVQPNYHPSTHAVKSDYSLASQWVVPTSFLFSNHQMRKTAVPPTPPHFKNMRIGICCVLGKGNGRARWGFRKSCFTRLIQCMLWQTESHMDWHFLQKRIPAHIVQLHIYLVLGLLERSPQPPNVVAWIIWNFTTSGLPDENHYKASAQTVKREGDLLFVCVCFMFVLLFILSTSIPTKKKRVIRRRHNY